MYIPPILLSERQISEQIIKQTDDEIVYEVERQLMIDIDKEELIKALNCDRDQYNHGVKDGKMHIIDILRDRITTYREDLQYQQPEPLVAIVEVNTLDWVLSLLDDVEESVNG